MIIDAYSHTGLPRFQSVAGYRALMARNGIGRAVLSSFDSSPDLAGIHAALVQYPEVFRGLGVPLGNGRAEIEAGAVAQLAAGFSGLRLTDRDVIDRPWLLNLLGKAGGIALVAGQAATPAVAGILLEALGRHRQLRVVGGHFAGGGEARALAAPPVAELFAHERFFIVFSRHGGYPADAILSWAEAVIAAAGWGRIMWGAEAPVLFWRNETLPQAIAWIDRFAPTAAQSNDFFTGNAGRLYFDRPLVTAPLALPFDPWRHTREIPATMWSKGLPIRQELAGRLVDSWLAAGADGTLGSYLETVLDGALPKLPSGD